MPTFFSSIVLENKKLNDKFHHLRLRAENPDFQFKTGQFTVLKIDSLTYRSYSISSTPQKLPLWEMFVDVTPQGPGTRYLESLKPGQAIETSRPAGNFIITQKAPRNIIFGATGCGIASIKPLIEQLLTQPASPAKQNEQPAIHIQLFWGLRHIKDIVWQENFKQWAKDHPSFHYQIYLSRPEGPWDGKTGHINTGLLTLTKTLLPLQTAVYLCGSLEMITDITEQLSVAGFPDKQIFFEHYFAGNKNRT